MKTPTRQQDWTLASYFAEKYKPERTLTPRTVSYIESTIRRFNKWRGQEDPLDEVTEQAVDDWQASMRREGLTLQVCRNNRNAVMAIVNDVARKRREALARKPARTRRGPKDWTPQEIAALLRAARGLRDSKPNVPRKLWWTAFVHLTVDTRLSLFYLTRIRRQDITPSGILTVRLREPKRLYSCQLSRETVVAIETLKRFSASRRILPKLDAGELQSTWLLICRRAGLRFQLRPTQTRRFQHPDLHYASETPTDPQDVRTLAQFFTTLYCPLKLRTRSPRTVVLYSGTIRLFGRFLGRPPVLTDLTDDVVTRHLSWLKANEYAPHSVEKERCQLLALWRFACQRHYVRDFPTVQKERLPERAPVCWTVDDLTRIFAAVENVRGSVSGVLASAWWRALLLTLYNSGERITAILQLPWSRIDLERGFVTVPAELRKGQTADMVTELFPETVEALLAIASPKRELVFPWDREPSYIWGKLGQILKQAGLPHDSRRKFHCIRRTTASYYERNGGDAMKLLGHTSRKVTNRYLDQTIVNTKQAAALLPVPVLSKGGA